MKTQNLIKKFGTIVIEYSELNTDGDQFEVDFYNHISNGFNLRKECLENSDEKTIKIDFPVQNDFYEISDVDFEKLIEYIDLNVCKFDIKINLNYKRMLKSWAI